MIILRRLTAFNLATTYARVLESNKICHYYVTHAKTLTDPKSAEEMIVEYIKKETGDDSVIIEETKINNAYGIGLESVQLAKDVLQDLPKVKKQLEKREVKSQILQYNQRDPWYKYLLNPIAIPYNWIVSKINAKWADYQWKKLGGFPKTKLGEGGYLDLRNQIKSIPLLPIAGLRRYCTPCHFLTVTFDESNRSEAIKILQNDLNILSDKKLIMGHLAMPFQLQLADAVGSGELSYVIGCFLFVDDRRIEKLMGKNNWREASFNKLGLNTLLGLKTETFEGGLSDVDLRKKYEIEEINIFEHEKQEHYDAYLIVLQIQSHRVSLLKKHAQNESHS